LDVVSSCSFTLPPRPVGKLSLPYVISKSKAKKPLTIVGSRRSPRLHTPVGFNHVQLDSTPRKHRRAQPEGSSHVVPSLDAPPKPTNDQIPAPVPLEILQGRGLQCNVPPEEVTLEALLKNKVQDDNDA